jgi:phenylacetic acid degradation protein
MIQSFKGMIPVIHTTSYIQPTAVVLGHVTIGPDCYIGPGAVLRGDWGKIIIGEGCNVQENCVLHMFPGKSVILKNGAHVGHGASIHGATLG